MIRNQAIGGGTLQPVPQEEKRSEVSQALTDLSYVIERYDDIVGRLYGRLDSVVVSSEPQVGTNPTTEDYQTHLGRHIDSMRCTVRDITDRLESLLKRIEL